MDANKNPMPVSPLPTKPHYMILDGLRGMAAVMVVVFHLFEGLANGDHHVQIINHGYLAVDFFFVLSGFVVGYAYDDRWGQMSLGGFLARRLIRLHPMIILGTLIGAVTFYPQACSIFPDIAQTGTLKFLLVTLVGLTLIPILPSMDIRGWDEMHPLDGPAWTLFFEYLANLVYALVLRKSSQKTLALMTGLAACATVLFAVTNQNGDMVGGWSFNFEQLTIGFTRLTFPFLAGLLLSRTARLVRVRHAFLLCSILLIACFSIPRLGGHSHEWVNGLYEACCIIFLFPLVVVVGAGGSVEGRAAQRVCRFLGDISYPLYMTHYPFIYLYYALMLNQTIPESMTIPGGLVVLFGSIALAYGSSRFYDLPVREWLKGRFLDQRPVNPSPLGQPGAES